MGDLSAIYGGQGFDTGSVEPASGFELLPAGWYPVSVESAEIRDTKAGTGKYLHLELEVIGEQYAGRKLFPNINLLNPNPTATEIGQRELAALGQAAGLAILQGTDELLGKQVECRVKIEKGTNGYEDDNTVTAYRALGAGNSAGASRPVPQQRTAPAPQRQAPAQTAGKPAGGKRPWER